MWLCPGGLQPAAARGSDVRGMVAAAIEEAKRIPEAPPVPVNYSSLQRSIQEWIEQLEGTNSDVATAQQVGSVQRVLQVASCL